MVHKIKIEHKRKKNGLQGILRMNAPQNDVGAAIHSTKHLELIP